MVRGKRYIHYGSNEYDSDRFVPVQNVSGRNKPMGGIWASHVNAVFGWKDFCVGNDFCVEELKESFKFLIDSSANVVEIHTHKDWYKLIEVKNRPKRMVGRCPDFEEMKRQGVDAIEIFITEDPEVYYGLYGWDVDSILVMNPEIIIPC